MSSITVRGKVGVGGGCFSNMLKQLAMVVTAQAMVVACKGRPVWEGETVLAKGDNHLVVHWVMNCK